MTCWCRRRRRTTASSGKKAERRQASHVPTFEKEATEPGGPGVGRPGCGHCRHRRRAGPGRNRRGGGGRTDAARAYPPAVFPQRGAAHAGRQAGALLRRPGQGQGRHHQLLLRQVRGDLPAGHGQPGEGPEAARRPGRPGSLHELDLAQARAGHAGQAQGLCRDARRAARLDLPDRRARRRRAAAQEPWLHQPERQGGQGPEPAHRQRPLRQRTADVVGGLPGPGERRVDRRVGLVGHAAGGQACDGPGLTRAPVTSTWTRDAWTIIRQGLLDSGRRCARRTREEDRVVKSIGRHAPAAGGVAWLTLGALLLLVLAAPATRLSAQTKVDAPESPLFTTFNPPAFDFNDAFYTANGIDVTQLDTSGAARFGLFRQTGPPAPHGFVNWVVDNTGTDPDRNNVRILATTAGYIDDGTGAPTQFISLIAFLLDQTFFTGVANARGVQMADIVGNFEAYEIGRASCRERV